MTFFTVAAASRIICWPTRVEPVSETLRTTGEAMIGAVGRRGRADDEVDGARRQVAGAGSSRRSPSPTPGVWLDGRTTTEQPAASAGATLRRDQRGGEVPGGEGRDDADRLAGHLEAAARRRGSRRSGRRCAAPPRRTSGTGRSRGPTRARTARAACRSRREIIRAASSLRRIISSAMACSASARSKPASPARRRGRGRRGDRRLGVGRGRATGASPSGFSVTGLDHRRACRRPPPARQRPSMNRPKLAYIGSYHRDALPAPATSAERCALEPSRAISQRLLQTP